MVFQDPVTNMELFLLAAAHYTVRIKINVNQITTDEYKLYHTVYRACKYIVQQYACKVMFACISIMLLHS